MWKNGILLLNGEFNVFDLNDLGSCPTLVSVPNVYREEDGDIIPVLNIWNSDQFGK